ncbi:transcriptional regulator [Cryobacterium sp. TmT2-59]|uniref:transcriptional regulator n=1 Tax=unclassified Cryobacterium TaxID=2649013 RepID=UPI00106A3CC9|nr:MULTISPECIES: transcriptional regulator [unclassified Cryobacterium]TFC83658.1 transcriptional regulator [Cryobacterium sp. TmT2-59]TFD13631.1 transcriptional regulator [Cryobacterium sp. TMT4-10]
MTSPWTVGSASDLSEGSFVKLARAHEAAVLDKVARPGVRKLVQESWDRSLSLRLDPSRLAPERELTFDELRDKRDQHALASVLAVVHNLLIRHSFDSGLIVAIGDEFGRLLWIDGDREVRRRAEGMLFVEGSDGSERRVGTSVPGTALALDHGIQIQRAEHFNHLAHPWSCTAVPIHDPDSGDILGVIDITGGAEAVAPQTLPLVEAAVAAMEAELRIQRLSASAAAPTVARFFGRALPAPPVRTSPARLEVLGRDHGQLENDGGAGEVSPRHAEILTLLAWNRDGLSADRLSLLLTDQANGVDNLRAEMVRLRKVLEQTSPRIGIASRPYRLETPLELDAQRVLAFLERGAHRVALGAYRGPVLPGSSAPGIIEIRTEVSARLREAMLSDASAELLLEYARTDEATYDSEVWRACLELLPARSPKRASVVARLKRIDAEMQQRGTEAEPRKIPQR